MAQLRMCDVVRLRESVRGCDYAKAGAGSELTFTAGQHGTVTTLFGRLRAVAVEFRDPTTGKRIGGAVVLPEQVEVLGEEG